MLDNTDRLFHYFVISLFHLRVLYECDLPNDARSPVCAWHARNTYRLESFPLERTREYLLSARAGI